MLETLAQTVHAGGVPSRVVRHAPFADTSPADVGRSPGSRSQHSGPAPGSPRRVVAPRPSRRSPSFGRVARARSAGGRLFVVPRESAVGLAAIAPAAGRAPQPGRAQRLVRRRFSRGPFVSNIYE